ncbi:MAG: hypothetical protein PVF70_11130 [Anaerolineales bacterium]
MTSDHEFPHRRWFRCGGITVQVESRSPLGGNTFLPKFDAFEVTGPGEEPVVIRHHFSLPDLEPSQLGKLVSRKGPWAIFQKAGSWIYLGVTPQSDLDNPYQVAIFNSDHSRGDIHHRDDSLFRSGGMATLTGFPSDQIMLARVLADRQGFYLHSSGAILDGQALLFAGRSGAGKSTMIKQLQDKVEVLCDDRNIVRRRGDDFWAFGTWSHGELPVVSTRSAPLRAILFLEQASENRIQRIEERKESIRLLLASLVRALETPDWWQKTLTLIESVARQVSCSILHFDTSGRVLDVLKEMVELDQPGS